MSYNEYVILFVIHHLLHKAIGWGSRQGHTVRSLSQLSILAILTIRYDFILKLLGFLRQNYQEIQNSEFLQKE